MIRWQDTSTGELKGEIVRGGFLDGVAIGVTKKDPLRRVLTGSDRKVACLPGGLRAPHSNVYPSEQEDVSKIGSSVNGSGRNALASGYLPRL